MSEAVKKTANNPVKAGIAGPGRPKGVPNKNTSLLKDAILKAAAEAGGNKGLVGYLKDQAIANPPAFMSLLGKVLPMQVVGDPDEPLVIQSIILRGADVRSDN